MFWGAEPSLLLLCKAYQKWWSWRLWFFQLCCRRELKRISFAIKIMKHKLSSLGSCPMYLVLPKVSKLQHSYCNSGKIWVAVMDPAPALQRLSSSVATATFFDTARNSCCRSSGPSGIAMAPSGVASWRERRLPPPATHFEADDTGLTH